MVLAGDEQYIRTSAESGWGPLATITPVLFGRSSHLALHGDRVYAANTDRYEIAVYSSAGTLEILIRRAAPNRPITDADLNVARTQTISRFDDAESRRLFEEIFAAMPLSATMPAFRTMSVDGGGNVWVQEYAPPGDPTNEWTAFDPSGRMLGTIRVPERFRPLHIGEDFVLGSWQDALDVPHVRLYAVDRSPGFPGR